MLSRPATVHLCVPQQLLQCPGAQLLRYPGFNPEEHAADSPEGETGRRVVAGECGKERDNKENIHPGPSTLRIERHWNCTPCTAGPMQDYRMHVPTAPTKEKTPTQTTRTDGR